MKYFLTHTVSGIDVPTNTTTEFFETKDELHVAYYEVVNSIQEGEYGEFVEDNLQDFFFDEDGRVEVELLFDDKYFHTRYSLFGGALPNYPREFTNSLL